MPLQHQRASSPPRAPRRFLPSHKTTGALPCRIKNQVPSQKSQTNLRMAAGAEVWPPKVQRGCPARRWRPAVPRPRRWLKVIICS
jgi:hypothetical protein